MSDYDDLIDLAEQASVDARSVHDYDVGRLAKAFLKLIGGYREQASCVHVGHGIEAFWDRHSDFAIYWCTRCGALKFGAKDWMRAKLVGGAHPIVVYRERPPCDHPVEDRHCVGKRDNGHKTFWCFRCGSIHQGESWKQPVPRL